MFRPVTQNSAPVRLRIGFIVQNKNQSIEKLSSVVSNELYRSSFNVNLLASVEVLSANEALDIIEDLHGLFISGKLQVIGENISILPAEIDTQLNALLQQAIINQLPVLSTSNGFVHMNNAMFTNSALDCEKEIKSSLHNKKMNTLSSFFVHPVQSKEKDIIEPTADSQDKLACFCGVKFEPYGLLAKMSPGKHDHKLYISDRKISALSSLLIAEAYDDDNVVVSFSLASKKSFYLAVNWKLEANDQQLFFNQQLIKSFILACRKFKKCAVNKVSADYRRLL